MKGRDRAHGFTLIEVLVAMGLLGIVLALIMNWQMSTLSISTRTNAMARSMNDLNDVTGYLGDRVRAATRVRVATSGLSINGKACTATNPCLAVVVPEPREDGEVRKYNLFVYRMSPRTEANPDFLTTDSWADGQVAVLQEFRSEDTASTPVNCVVYGPALTPAIPRTTFAASTAAGCDAMRNLDSQTTLSGFGKYLVADYLTPAGELPTSKQPFAYNAASRELTLNFRNKQRVRGTTTYLPATEPFTMTVQARNVP